MDGPVKHRLGVVPSWETTTAPSTGRNGLALFNSSGVPHRRKLFASCLSSISKHAANEYAIGEFGVSLGKVLEWESLPPPGYATKVKPHSNLSSESRSNSSRADFNRRGASMTSAGKEIAMFESVASVPGRSM